MLGGMGSTIRLTTASTSTGPSCAKASAMPRSTCSGVSSLMPRTPTACAMAAKFGFLKLVPVSRKPDDFCSISMKPSAPLLNTTTLHRQAELHEAQEIAHQHGEAAIAGQRDHLPAGKRGLGADRLRHRVR